MRHCISLLCLFLMGIATISTLQAQSAPTSVTTPDSVYQHFNPETKKWTFDKLDQPPVPNGGEKNFWNIVYSQMSYPDVAQRNHIQGDVIITLTVDEKGLLDALEVKEGLGYKCDEEAFNAIRLAASNRFIPAKQNGKVVKSKYDVSITFDMGR